MHYIVGLKNVIDIKVRKMSIFVIKWTFGLLGTKVLSFKKHTELGMAIPWQSLFQGLKLLLWEFCVPEYKDSVYSTWDISVLSCVFLRQLRMQTCCFKQALRRLVCHLDEKTHFKCAKKIA